MAEESASNLTAGEVAPAFELPGVDGETYTPASFADREALLVVFTCNHCPYAQAKFPLMNDLAAAYDEVAVVGINPNDDEQYPEDSFEEMVARVDDGDVDWDAYLRDESQEVAAAYDAACTPDPFLFAREDDAWRLVYQGRLDDAMNPDDDPTEFPIREAIEAVLAGETVDVEWVPSRGCSIKWREE